MQGATGAQFDRSGANRQSPLPLVRRFPGFSCFDALSQIHARNILHRAIGPGAIYVQPSLKVAFTNFYAARLGESSIAYSLDALAIEDPYAHLDLAIGYGYATPETDTFSLALVFL